MWKWGLDGAPRGPFKKSAGGVPCRLGSWCQPTLKPPAQPAMCYAGGIKNAPLGERFCVTGWFLVGGWPRLAPGLVSALSGTSLFSQSWLSVFTHCVTVRGSTPAPPYYSTTFRHATTSFTTPPTPAHCPVSAGRRSPAPAASPRSYRQWPASSTDQCAVPALHPSPD